MVAARAAIAVKFLDGLRHRSNAFRIVEGALHETNAVGKLLQVDSLNGVRQCASTFSRTKFLKCSFGPIAAGEAGQTEAWRQQATVGQIVDCGSSFYGTNRQSHRKSRCCTDRQYGKSQIARVAQWIRPRAGRVGCG